ncbi:hypothetical protein ACRRTK_004789 [Alexandromys fortis]
MPSDSPVGSCALKEFVGFWYGLGTKLSCNWPGILSATPYRFSTASEQNKAVSGPTGGERPPSPVPPIRAGSRGSARLRVPQALPPGSLGAPGRGPQVRRGRGAGRGGEEEWRGACAAGEAIAWLIVAVAALPLLSQRERDTSGQAQPQPQQQPPRRHGAARHKERCGGPPGRAGGRAGPGAAGPGAGGPRGSKGWAGGAEGPGGGDEAEGLGRRGPRELSARPGPPAGTRPPGAHCASAAPRGRAWPGAVSPEAHAAHARLPHPLSPARLVPTSPNSSGHREASGTAAAAPGPPRAARPPPRAIAAPASLRPVWRWAPILCRAAGAARPAPS